MVTVVQRTWNAFDEMVPYTASLERGCTCKEASYNIMREKL